jgi:hypothetical protein
MAQRFEAEELDNESLEYLRTAYRTEGEGMPGVYLDAREAKLPAAWLPVTGLVVGLVLIGLTLLVTMVWLALDDPINVAMLQTAGLLLGGWMVLAWVRTLLERRRADYIGHFKYADSQYLWHGAGRGVWVTPLGQLEEATVSDNYANEGQYTGSTVNIRLGDGLIGLETRTGSKAVEVAAFLNALPDRRNLPALERGYRARAVADRAVRNYGSEVLDQLRAVLSEQEVMDALPADEGEGDAYTGERAVTAIPEPHKTRTALGWWRYGVVLIVGVLLFFGSWKVSAVLRDDAFFDYVKSKRPPELRAYLIDGRNTRHREEAQKLLDRFHEQAAERIAKGPGNAELKKGLADIVGALKKDTHPVITLAFKAAPDSAKGDFPAEQVKPRQKAAARALAQHLANVVGPDMAAFGEAPEGKAMMEIAYKLTAPAAGAALYRMEWTVTLRAEPGEGAGSVYRTEMGEGGNRETVLQRLYDGLVNNLKQQLPSAPPAPVRPGRPGFPGGRLGP